MSTRTCDDRGPVGRTSTVSTPRPVSIVTGPAGARPRATTRWATHRMPLPHISASLPSALNIRIRATARGDGSTRIRPSPPTPRWRSAISAASLLGSAGVGSTKQSTYT